MHASLFLPDMDIISLVISVSSLQLPLSRINGGGDKLSRTG
jgi:hypothetical protein